ncbi:MAG: DUF1343 domain-containing protein [Bacteroidota bacterium]
MARPQVVTEPVERVQSELADVPSGREETPKPAPATASMPAAHTLELYLPLLRNKRLALLVNQTSTIGSVHLVDSLQALGFDLKKIFAPEHGFRGDADAGATIENGVDTRSGLPIKSLYGKNKKPSAADLADIDAIVFDIQDVGARFYTYISTLYYVMEAAALHGKEVIILDRPNPNGHLIDGPLLSPAFKSFVGIAPIPISHGLTVGEFAQMVNGEGWLADGVKAPLRVVAMPGYSHSDVYALPIPPSPNLPNQRSIYLYPSLCFFEGTAVSVGRGTNRQFQLFGHPKLGFGDIRFTPTSGPGSKYPKLEGQVCRGVDLSRLPTEDFRQDALNLEYLVLAYQDLHAQGVDFFTNADFFDKLAGTDQLRKAIIAGKSTQEIRAEWEQDLANYRALREQYRIYPD